jgi:hypothetical protein
MASYAGGNALTLMSRNIASQGQHVAMLILYSSRSQDSFEYCTRHAISLSQRWR